MSVSAKMIAVEQAFAEWRREPAYVAAYDALENEFAQAAARPAFSVWVLAAALLVTALLPTQHRH